LWVVQYWIGGGIVTAQYRKPNAPCAITVDDDSDRLIREWVAKSAHLERGNRHRHGSRGRSARLLPSSLLHPAIPAAANTPMASLMVEDVVARAG
jgi:hypothetical protein